MNASRAMGAASVSAGAAPTSPAPTRLENIESLTDAALGYLSFEDLIAELLERIRSALHADTVAVLLLDEERGVLVARAAKGLEEEVRQGIQVPLARGFAGRVAADDRPVIIDDLDRYQVVNPILGQKGIRSMLGVPMHVEGQVIGVMHVGTLHTRKFGQNDVRLLQLAADRAALAIDNARLSEQRAATQLMQRTLLPEALPELPGLRLSAKYLPAGAGVRMGGDWYDVIQLREGRVVFVIGDVVGRGVVAASVMAEARTALRAYLIEGHDLPSSMALLNDLLFAMGRSRSATAAMYELDLDRGHVTAVSAGHLPALLLSPDAESRFAGTASGLPLGLRPGRRYSPETIPFPNGSTLLLYTDGLVERRGEPVDTGLQRLREAARASSDAGPTFADLIYRELVNEEMLEDDLALLAIESMPMGDRLDLELPASASVLSGLRRTLGRWLIANRVPDDVRFDITVAVSEAAANAIEHAYGPGEGRFRLAGQLFREELRIRISDSGRWRAPRPDGRGRGLILIEKLVDSVQIDRTEGGTDVTLRKRLARSR